MKMFFSLEFCAKIFLVSSNFQEICAHSQLLRYQLLTPLLISVLISELRKRLAWLTLGPKSFLASVFKTNPA